MILRNIISLCENEINCSKASLFPCHHCSRKLCLEHINEHNELNIIRVDELFDDVNNLTQFLSNLNTENSLENARNKLNDWKKECWDRIENIYELNLNEINNLEKELNIRLNIYKENIETTISDLKSELSYFRKISEISEQQLSAIESNLNQLRECLQSVQCDISIEMKNISWKNLINIENIFSYDSRLINNTKIQSYRMISLENMKEFISSKKNQTILWMDTQRQLHFIDKHFQTHLLTLPEITSSAILSNHQNNIVDIKWYSFAEIYLILFQRNLFSFNPETQKFTQICLTRYKDYPFQRISCLNNSSIYISYSTSGVCIQLWKYIDNSINECIEYWDCLTDNKNEWISQMDTNEDFHIGLLIQNTSVVYRRFELRDEYMSIIKTIPLDNDYIAAFFPFRNNQWFMKSLLGKYYIYSIDTDKYHLSSFDFPFGLQEFGMNTLVIGNKEGELIYCDM